MPVSKRNIHPIIQQIINRDCHVGASNRTVVRHVISKLKHGQVTFKAMQKADRRILIEQCIAQHRANQQLYHHVMSGFSNNRKSRRDLSGPTTLSSAEICQLLKEHNCSVEYLAFRFGSRLSFIKKMVSQGINDSLVAQRWLNVIVNCNGELPKKFRIRSKHDQTDCEFCGCPLNFGDTAIAFANEVFCSQFCCRHQAG